MEFSDESQFEAELLRLLEEEPLVAGSRLGRTVLGVASAVITLSPDRFLLEAHTAEHADGIYVQGMVEDDGSLHLEAPSNEFLASPLTAIQVSALLELGWQPPQRELPNFWRLLRPTEIAPGRVADLLMRTLEIYGVDPHAEFTLSPASLAAAVLPDDGTIEIVPPPLVGPPADAADHLATLALSIARCSEVDRARADPKHPCHKVVCLQSANPHTYQLPEPWAGNLTDGRIVFVSSNPSVSEAGDHQSGETAEEYPTAAWDDARIADFITNRFTHGWATADGRFLRKDQTYSKPVAFWSRIRKRATELLNQEADPARDYVMTEVVHCKSKQEKGVSAAADLCAPRHLDRILTAASAPLIVILGARARDQLASAWDLPEGFGTKATVGVDETANIAIRNLGGRPRVVTYLWHPTGMTAPTKFTDAYPRHIERLRQLIAGDLPPETFTPTDDEDPGPPDTEDTEGPIDTVDEQLTFFGDAGSSWVRHLPTVWRAAAAPLPATSRDDVWGDRDDADEDVYRFEDPGWWLALIHLLTFGLGWSRPDLGLQRWIQAGQPTDDPILSLVSEWWGDTVMEIPIYSATGTGQYIDEATHWLAEHRRANYVPTVRPDKSWHHHINRGASLIQSTLNHIFGGHHLHLGGPLHENPSSRAHQPERYPDNDGGTTRMTLLLDRYAGWYRALMDVHDGRDERGRSVHVDVVCRPIGWLGEFRKSTHTGLWFRGQHSVHLLGN